MAPPGINTYVDMVVSSSFSPFAFSSSSHSSDISWILSDHDYVIKPQLDDMVHHVTTKSQHSDFPESDISNPGVMLNSSTADLLKDAEDIGDTDFLSNLGELDFSDLDTCSDVEMDDSFQNFIDSALEESSPSFYCNHTQPHDEESEINEKEEFLARLELKSNPATVTKSQPWPSLTSMAPGTLTGCTSSINDVVSDAFSPTKSNNSTPSFDVIPTKMCSCLESDTLPQAVYSTAHVNHQDWVRICPSSLATNIDKCSNCSSNKLISDRLLSPLYIDTSVSGYSEPFHPLPEDSPCVSIDRDQLKEVDKDTTDIMKWLKENQQSCNQNDCNNNKHSGNEVLQNGYNASTEPGSEKNIDLESFMDLEDFLNKAVDTNMTQTTINHSVQRSCSQSYLESKDSSCHSQLQLSFLDELPEHTWDNDYLRIGSHLDFFCEGFPQDSLTPTSSNFSSCGSPAWSASDSTQPSPLGSMNLSSSSNWGDVSDDSSLKSQLALLKLFSEENAESLLFADPAVPKTRLNINDRELKDS